MAPSKKLMQMKKNIIAGLWGFAEATLFFILPDVWTSIVGRKKLRVGLIACIYSLGGALLGGMLMYYWGKHDYTMASNIVEKVPAINRDMLLNVESEMRDHGALALFIGPVTGKPYKAYAISAPGTGIGFLVFLLISIPARFIRFVLITTLCHYAVSVLNRMNLKIHSLTVLLLGWAVMYAVYWSTTPW